MRKLMWAQGCGKWKVYHVRSMRTVFRPHGCRSVGSVLIFTTGQAGGARGACPRTGHGPARQWAEPRRSSRQFSTIDANRAGRWSRPGSCDSLAATTVRQGALAAQLQRLRDSMYEPYLQRMREDYMILEACTRIQINGVDQFPSFELPHPSFQSPPVGCAAAAPRT